MKTFFLTVFSTCLFYRGLCQEIIHYDMNVQINVPGKNLIVNGSIIVATDHKDTLSMVLWKNTLIHSIRIAHGPIKYLFDTLSPSPIQYIPNGRKLLLINPEKTIDTLKLFFNYECEMKNLDGWAKSFSEDWIEINYYSAWYPLNNESRNFTSNLNISIDNHYQVTGSGMISEHEGRWKMNQSWPGFDNVIIASPNLHSKIYKKGNVYIETDYSDFPDKDADSLLTECKFAVTLYHDYFGNIADSTYLKFIIAPFEQGGGYSRKNFISMRAKKLNIYTLMGVGHEIAHFWWHNADTQSWEDWLNESFAEYSMLLYFRDRLGMDVFKEKLEEYKKDAEHTPPIRGIDRTASEAYIVLYEKGSLILCEMEQRNGSAKFYNFLRTVAQKHIRSTTELLDLVAKMFSEDERNWLDDKISKS